MIKFVNYVRSQVKDGKAKPETENPASWDDEKFMQPVLEDDALLFSVDELESMEAGDANTGKQPEASSSNNATDEVAQLKEQLSKLQSKFDVYREQVSETLEKRWSDAPSKDDGAAEAKAKRYDDSYFDSYSFNDIHQVMLQDTVRTEAYRDFIYENKHLFAGKTVMDVGCGTGILSMFCAKAGAKQVFAMDNSAIIDKARQIAFENGLDKQITFIRGKVEDLHELPGNYKHVDIIVSEWMGYCLFFENMLPSVFCMRDRFMKRRADGSFDGIDFGAIKEGKIGVGASVDDILCLIYQTLLFPVPSLANGVLDIGKSALELVTTKLAGAITMLGCPAPINAG